jgi:cyanobactin maturation PatA/PatG family protease
MLIAAEHGARIINVSGGQHAPTGAAHPILADAVGQCARRGILIMAAAGNDGCECLHVPAALPGVLAVGAMDAQGRPLEASNWGDAYRTEGLLAPGAGLLGARAGGGTTRVNGTSFATAVATGAAGLLWSLALRRGWPVDGMTLRAILLDSAKKCRDDILACKRSLAGRLDLRKARERFAHLASSQGGENSEIFLDRRENRLDDHALRLARRMGVQALSRPARCMVSGDARMGDETFSSSTSAEFPLARNDEAAPEVMSARSTALAESATPSSLPPALTQSSGCGCASCQAKTATSARGLVFALGQIGYDLISEARRDSIQQHMGQEKSNPLDPAEMLEYLRQNPWEAASITWTLSVDQMVIYALNPIGPFAGETFQRLREFLSEQVAGAVDRVSIPGRLTGSVRLFSGQVVPAVIPELRGMYSWTTDALVRAAVGEPLPATVPAAEQTEYTQKLQAVRGFLDRVYYELRTLGLTAEDRALNFAGTNAFQIQSIFASAIQDAMELDSIGIERSQICRLDSDCWDVKVFFFYPKREAQSVRKVYRFTVDVSDVVPVMVGPVRSWFTR